MGISYQDLWLKSKMFIEKAIKQRDNGDYSEFQLWAALTLELLGKATLAHIHPSLVVDPNNPKGFLVACGHSDTTDYKTIGAKTVFERLNNLINVRRFDATTRDFCMRLANLRNEDLHSGALPFEGVVLDSWLPKYWDTCKMMLEFQNKNLVDFIGREEAEKAEEIITTRTVTLITLIESRIERHRREILQRYDGHIPMEIILADMILTEDFQELVTCPSCGSQTLIEGELVDEGPFFSDDDEPWIQWQEVTYEATSLSCRYSG